MESTLLFGNGLNRLSEGVMSWDDLLKKLKGQNIFYNGKLPNTMIYERVFLEKPISKKVSHDIELEKKQNSGSSFLAFF